MKIEAVLSPQFEICYALADLASPSPLADPAWAGLGFGVAEPQWLAEARLFGWAFWLAVPDILEDARPASSVGTMLDALRAVPPAEARRRLMRGLFHSDGTTPPPAKREWLAFIGLDDWAGGDATGAALKREAGALLNATLSVLDRFRPVFEPVWERLAPQLEMSRTQAERLARTVSVAELAKRLALQVEVDEARGVIQALRGGYAIRFDRSSNLYLLPSAFNRRGFWTAADGGASASLFFPYFDETLRIAGVAGAPVRVAAPAIDPWLVCKALGDPTRAAIVRRIAHIPQTSAELGAALGLSKANISHHIFQLRAAGLIEEKASGRSVRISLRLDTVDALSIALRRELGR